MDGQRRFAVIGTDARLAAAGRALARAGFAVGGPEQTALADYILLPLPLDESRTPLAELLRAAKPGALALGGKLSAQARQIYEAVFGIDGTADDTAVTQHIKNIRAKLRAASVPEPEKLLNTVWGVGYRWKSED